MTGATEVLRQGRSGAAYGAHSYHTKVPPAAISELIRRHLPGGGRVADSFCGSGTTGVAAALAEVNLPQSESYDVLLGDLSPYATFIAEALNVPPPRAEFEAAANQTLEAAEAEVSRFWITKHSDGRIGTVIYVIWSEVLACPGCDEPHRFWDLAVDLDRGAIRRSLTCRCGATFTKIQAKRVTENTLDPLLASRVRRPARVPVRIAYEVEGRRFTKEPDDFDREIIAESLRAAAPSSAPNRLMLDREGPWGDLHRSGYHEGITHVHQFYTWRNFLTVGHLWDAAHSSAVPHATELLVSSYNLAHSTQMSRVVFKRGTQAPVLTGYQTGTLYISSLPVEKNPLIGIKRKKLSDLQRAFELTRNRRGEVHVITGPAQAWAQLETEIDYAFVDPPFGANIPYAEANFIAEAWLGEATVQEHEATMSKAQGKSADDYRELLAESFEALRSHLSPTGRMTVMFHSADSEPWDALIDALADARLEITDVLLLDKGQGSFKQVRTEGAVEGDLLINTRIARASGRRGQQDMGLKAWLINELSAQNGHLTQGEKRRLFSRYLASNVAAGKRVSVSATEFYEAADTIAQRLGLAEAA